MANAPLNGDMPSWLKASVYLGVPSVIALFLVYMLTVQVNTAMSELRQTQALQAQTLLEMQKGIVIRMQNVEVNKQVFMEATSRIERLLQRTCIVAAATVEERATCLNSDSDK